MAVLLTKSDCSSQISRRAEQTDDPVIVKTKQLIAGTQNVISLAQGQSCSIPSILLIKSVDKRFQWWPKTAKTCQRIAFLNKGFIASLT